MTESVMQHQLVDEQILEQGMKVQLNKWKGMLESGCKRAGWKIGLDDLADQRRMRLTAPAVGFLTSKSVLESGGIYKVSKADRLMVKAELAILLGQDASATRPVTVQPDDQIEVSLSPLGSLSVKIMD